MKIAICQINPVVGGLSNNRKKIITFIKKAKQERADLAVFPEMALLGYPPEDLLLIPSFIDALQQEVDALLPETKGIGVILGTVRKNPSLKEKSLLNTALFIDDGKILGCQDKSLLPDYDVFSERRYFEPATSLSLFSYKGETIALTICEDIWEHAGQGEYTSYIRDPILELKEKQPTLLINISASPYYYGRAKTRLEVLSKAAATLKAPALLVNQVGANDSLIFEGQSLYCDGAGKLSALGRSFQEDLFFVDTKQTPTFTPFIPSSIEELFSALVLGISDYFHKLGFKKALLGVSGGIDSAVALALAVKAFGKENVLACFLPSCFTSDASYEDAKLLCKNFGVPLEEISIEAPHACYLELLKPQFEGMKEDTTEENLQARIRGTILMALSNKLGHILLATANKSELSLGYATLYGDLCGALAPLSDVLKGQVYQLAEWINKDKELIPRRVIERAPSAELRPNQKDQDSLPPYEIVDKVIQGYVERHESIETIARVENIPLETVEDLVRKIHLSEYKRRQGPLGLRVTKKAFSVGRRFPIVQKWRGGKGDS